MMETDQFQSILRMFNYGLYVITCASSEGAPAAATVSWVTQVSFKPKLIAVALRKGTAICEAVQAARRFGLHVVGEQQPELARAFFKVGQVSPSEIGGYSYGFTERRRGRRVRRPHDLHRFGAGRRCPDAGHPQPGAP
jgi:flavin reductase (DIM6/NTAB) family NADH-FMN oxidoreductase RutF